MSKLPQVTPKRVVRQVEGVVASCHQPESTNNYRKVPAFRQAGKVACGGNRGQESVLQYQRRHGDSLGCRLKLIQDPKSMTSFSQISIQTPTVAFVFNFCLFVCVRFWIFACTPFLIAVLRFEKQDGRQDENLLLSRIPIDFSQYQKTKKVSFRRPINFHVISLCVLFEYLNYWISQKLCIFHRKCK